MKISLELTLKLMKMGDKHMKKIIKILEGESVSGSTINELVKTSKLSRSAVRATSL